jgi:hypothetical protein
MCHVGGHLEYDRAGPAGTHLRERPSQLVRDRLCSLETRRPLRNRAIGLDRVEGRPEPEPRSWCAGRQEQDRDGICKRLGDTSKGVLGAWSLLNHAHADPMAVVRPGEPHQPC